MFFFLLYIAQDLYKLCGGLFHDLLLSVGSPFLCKLISVREIKDTNLMSNGSHEFICECSP